MLKQSSPAPLRRGIVKLWFAFDAVVALAPPLYWAADGRTATVAGLPTALFCPTSAPVGQIEGLHERRMAGSS